MKNFTCFTKFNAISDNRKLPGGAFADHRIIPFQDFPETSPTFSVSPSMLIEVIQCKLAASLP